MANVDAGKLSVIDDAAAGFEVEESEEGKPDGVVPSPFARGTARLT